MKLGESINFFFDYIFLYVMARGGTHKCRVEYESGENEQNTGLNSYLICIKMDKPNS